ncbi:hypothetical protein D3C84_725310 [compost metagenome]
MRSQALRLAHSGASFFPSVPRSAAQNCNRSGITCAARYTWSSITMCCKSAAASGPALASVPRRSRAKRERRPRGWPSWLIKGEKPVSGCAGLAIHAESLECCTKSLRNSCGNWSAAKIPGCAARGSMSQAQALLEPSSTIICRPIRGSLHWASFAALTFGTTDRFMYSVCP